MSFTDYDLFWMLQYFIFASSHSGLFCEMFNIHIQFKMFKFSILIKSQAMICALAELESDRQPLATRYNKKIKETTVGIMQLLPKTAEWLVRYVS